MASCWTWVLFLVSCKLACPNHPLGEEPTVLDLPVEVVELQALEVEVVEHLALVVEVVELLASVVVVELQALVEVVELLA